MIPLTGMKRGGGGDYSLGVGEDSEQKQFQRRHPDG